MVYAVGRLWVGAIGHADVVGGHDILQECGKKSSHVAEGSVWYQKEVSRSRFNYPFCEVEVRVVALRKNEGGNRFASLHESVPCCGCRQSLVTLCVECHKRDVAESCRVEELLFIGNGCGEMVVGVLNEGE